MGRNVPPPPPPIGNWRAAEKDRMKRFAFVAKTEPQKPKPKDPRTFIGWALKAFID